MIITAKYGSRCPKCATLIAIGERVEWTRGGYAKHITCPSLPANTRRTEADALRDLCAGAARLCVVRENIVWIAHSNGVKECITRTERHETVLAPMIAAMIAEKGA